MWILVSQKFFKILSVVDALLNSESSSLTIESSYILQIDLSISERILYLVLLNFHSNDLNLVGMKTNNRAKELENHSCLLSLGSAAVRYQNTVWWTRHLYLASPM